MRITARSSTRLLAGLAVVGGLGLAGCSAEAPAPVSTSSGSRTDVITLPEDTSTPTPSSSGPTLITPGCLTRQLTVRAAAAVVAAGVSVREVGVVNTSATVCSVQGYPAARILDKGGRVLATAGRDPALAPAGAGQIGLIILPAGGSARFRFAVGVAGRCATAVRGPRLQVSVPNQITPLYLSGSFAACQLRVGPIT